MKALIKPKEYFLKEIFKKEEELLFSEIWNFVGFTWELENNNDFIALKIAGMPIVVQNMNGILKAFKNVCSHRHSILQTKEKGNRALFCPYHGWSYNDKGVPFGIPKKPLFNFSKEELECLKLEEYKVDICGSMVFVTIRKDPETLEKFLGDFYNIFNSMSINFGKLIDVNEIEIKANWKLVVENTLESYHVALIHSDSFKNLGAEGLNFSFSGDHSLWNAKLAMNENDGKQEKVHKPYQNRNFKINGYDHFILFPNILISTTYGVSFNLSHIVPIDNETTFFRSYVFMTKLDSERINNPLENMYEYSLTKFNRQVFDEDKIICEEVQKGVRFSIFDGELSEEEMRVRHFQERYRFYLDKK
jgi:phenylpropionate dioxygenase-like ring-hydroxylating dioxygenase large terminal subunit